MRKRWLTWLGAALVVAFLAAWGIGEVAYPGTNPPQRYDGTILSAASDPLLRQACFDCHSNETRHPWYHHLPIAGLLMTWHIREGRGDLNFSTWPELDAARQQRQMRRVVRALQRDRMPTKDYRFMHPDARLSPEQVAQIVRDAQERYGVQADLATASARN